MSIFHKQTPFEMYNGYRQDSSRTFASDNAKFILWDTKNEGKIACFFMVDAFVGEENVGSFHPVFLKNGQFWSNIAIICKKDTDDDVYKVKRVKCFFRTSGDPNMDETVRKALKRNFEIIRDEIITQPIAIIQCDE
jgi:hypothetical protein